MTTRQIDLGPGSPPPAPTAEHAAGEPGAVATAAATLLFVLALIAFAAGPAIVIAVWRWAL